MYKNENVAKILKHVLHKVKTQKQLKNRGSIRFRSLFFGKVIFYKFDFFFSILISASLTCLKDFITSITICIVFNWSFFRVELLAYMIINISNKYGVFKNYEL